MRRRFDRSIDLDFIITKALFCSPIVRLRGSAQHFPVSAGQDRSPSLSFALVFLPRRFPSLNFCTRLLFGSKKKKKTPLWGVFFFPSLYNIRCTPG